MADADGDDAAVVLLRVMPADVVASILDRLDAGIAERLRARLKDAPADPPAGPELDDALTQFFDLQRIVKRAAALGGPGGAPAEGAPEAATPMNPIDELRSLPPERLALALEGEQPGTVALVLSCLDPTAAGQVMKRMTTEFRADVALRVAKLGARNQALLQRLAQALADKARRMADVPPEPSADEIVTNVADMLRAMPRLERAPVLKKIEAADPDFAAKVLEKLSRIEDLVKIPDRQLQGLLAELDVKTIATALKGTHPSVRAKVTSNMSSRSRAVLDEESDLLGDVPPSRVKEARGTVLALIRKGEDEGTIIIEE